MNGWIEDPEFDRLAKIWTDETGHHSNPSIIMRHEACRKIIAMGRDVWPRIFQAIERNEPGAWTAMLWEIFGDVIEMPDEERGRVAMNDARWLIWGSENGYMHWQQNNSAT